MNTKMHAVDIN